MRLLLIEDDAALRLTLARQLEADGYRVDQARDGEEGLFRMRSINRVPCALGAGVMGRAKVRWRTAAQRLGISMRQGSNAS